MIDADIVADFRRDGFVILPGFPSPAGLAAALALARSGREVLNQALANRAVFHGSVDR